MSSGSGDADTTTVTDMELYPEMETVLVSEYGIPVPKALLAPPFQYGAPQRADGWGQIPTEQDEPPQTPIEALAQTLPDDTGYADVVERADLENMCALCNMILQALGQHDLREQVVGVGELAVLKKAAGKGASPLEIADLMDDFEVVADPEEMVGE